MASYTVSKLPLKIVLFLGTVRENRLGLRVAKFMVNQLEKTGHDVTLFDPEVMSFPMLHKPVFHYGKDREGAPDWLVKAEQQVKDADAYVIVSGEYNHSIPPALSNMMDYFGGSSYSWKASGIVCYSPGIYGGMRSAMQLRAFLGELGCLSVSNIFGIPKVHEALNENGEPLNDHMEKGAQRLISQLDWNAHAMRNQRNNFGTP
ncbi:quinone reductase-like [Saccoglossus kowalevskii]|uniref:Uncharacterized protein LOC100370698 n=1 Tax=Saccoglossus kowalevskii TaxID=10224 RepID=A0ABM0GLJ2_SACKO|nr:PREDICTED: uncharacterized protein LOC100370698 [Saccoglossus kowalevskii]